ncbi:glycosyltransferase [Aeromicrobium massiliense]|uniref:glycosyltransferase n=1 Tax=Aeromicrobium massiliense TaxID=1464554 RepID=UPI000578B070|nr:glycosyltransferase [Aeromicrobium massiliense]
MTADEAVAHFLARGAAEGLRPNPLTETAVLRPEAVREAVLDGSARTLPVRRWFDDVGFVAAVPDSVDHPGGPVGAYLDRARAAQPTPKVEGRSWADFVVRREKQAKALRAILRSGVVDREFYERQVGRTFPSGRAAAWHFLEEGEADGLSLTPIFVGEWYRRTSGARGTLLLSQLLRAGQSRGAAGPHLDLGEYVLAHPEALEHRSGPLAHFLEEADDDTMTVPTPGSGVRPARFGTLRATMMATADELGLAGPRTVSTVAAWAVAAGSPTRCSSTASVAVLLDAHDWDAGTIKTLRSVLDQTHEHVVLRVAVEPEAGSRVEIEPRTAGHRVEWVETAARDVGTRLAAVAATAAEDFVMVWQPQESWHPDLLCGLVTAAGDGVGAYAAIHDEAAGATVGPLPLAEHRVWHRARPLSGVLVRRVELVRAGFAETAGDQRGWELLLRLGDSLTFAPFIGVRGRDLGREPAPRGWTSTDENVVRAQRIVDWAGAADELPTRVADRVSLVVPTYRDWQMTTTAVASALAHGSGDMEVVIVDNGSAPDVALTLAATFAGDDRVVVRHVPVNTNFATGSNLGAVWSTGETVVFLNNDTVAQPDWLEPLVAALAEPGVLGTQSLLLYPDGTIQTAGTVFHGPHTVASHFLAGHPVEDLVPEIDLRFRAATAACLMMRAQTVVSARGFDPVFVNGMEDVDLCLRVAQQQPGAFVTVPASRVVHAESKTPGRMDRIEPNRLRFLARWGAELPGPDDRPWQQAGFAVAQRLVDGGLPASRRRTSVRTILSRPRATVQDGPAAGLPSLRWSIKIAAPAGPLGEAWGDTHFAADLARALRRYGQQVVVDRREVHVRPASDYLDDVTLTLRGLDRVSPQPGATNLLWVISHPDDVSDDELRSGFDRIYAASRSWADRATTRSGVSVRPLLQATDPDRFSPQGAATAGLGVLFVGNSRKVFRPVVRDAVAAGADLTVFGRDWDGLIDPQLVRAELLPNEQLPAAYRGADVVLNDHWRDMAVEGFVSNRLFDAVAAGARVVSDAVEGLDALFGGSVQVYRTADDLSTLLDPACARWPDDEARRANARAVAEHHSFDARARTLLADVLDQREVDHSLRVAGPGPAPRGDV